MGKGDSSQPTPTIAASTPITLALKKIKNGSAKKASRLMAKRVSHCPAASPPKHRSRHPVQIRAIKSGKGRRHVLSTISNTCPKHRSLSTGSSASVLRNLKRLRAVEENFHQLAFDTMKSTPTKRRRDERQPASKRFFRAPRDTMFTPEVVTPPIPHSAIAFSRPEFQLPAISVTSQGIHVQDRPGICNQFPYFGTMEAFKNPEPELMPRLVEPMGSPLTPPPQLGEPHLGPLAAYDDSWSVQPVYRM